jgi:hypothetical protein
MSITPDRLPDIGRSLLSALAALKAQRPVPGAAQDFGWEDAGVAIIALQFQENQNHSLGRTAGFSGLLLQRQGDLFSPHP